MRAQPKVEFLDPKNEDLVAMGTRIGETILDSGIVIKQIIPVSRGGLPYGFLMAKLLDIKDVQTLCSDLYIPNPNPDGPPEVAKGEPDILREPELLNEGGGEALIVEDVIDTGITMTRIRNDYPDATIMAMYSKKPYEEAIKLVNFFGKYVEPHVWIRFPFEVNKIDRT